MRHYMNIETYSSLNDEQIHLEQIEFAIDHCLKISFQLNDTSQFEFAIFHPYALLTDVFADASIIGLMERNHAGSSINQIARIKLSTITFIEILPADFNPNHVLWRTFEVRIPA